MRLHRWTKKPWQAGRAWVRAALAMVYDVRACALERGEEICVSLAQLDKCSGMATGAMMHLDLTRQEAQRLVDELLRVLER